MMWLHNMLCEDMNTLCLCFELAKTSTTLGWHQAEGGLAQHCVDGVTQLLHGTRAGSWGLRSQAVHCSEVDTIMVFGTKILCQRNHPLIFAFVITACFLNTYELYSSTTYHAICQMLPLGERRICNIKERVHFP